jgi:hypothetical protein
LRSTLAANARRDYEPIRWDVMKRRYLDIIQALSRETAVAPRSAVEPKSVAR